jgi:hypothetical protein
MTKELSFWISLLVLGVFTVNLCVVIVVKLQFFIQYLSVIFQNADEVQTSEEKKQECKYLNSVRANFTFCCRYPMLVIWRWQHIICRDACKAQEDYGLHFDSKSFFG